MCRIRQLLAVLRSFFHSSLLCTFSCHPSLPTILPSSLTPSCHLFLGLPLNLVVSKFIYNTFLGILFCSILCTCQNQRNLFKLTVSIIAGFLTIAYISLLVNILQFSFSLSYTGPKILLYTFLSKIFNCFLSLFVIFALPYLSIHSVQKVIKHSSTGLVWFQVHKSNRRKTKRYVCCQHGSQSLIP